MDLRLSLAAFASVLVLERPTAAAAQTSDDLFDPNTIHEVRLFVWDKDTTFLDPAFSILTRSDQNVIFRRALSVPPLRSVYLQVLGDCARAAAADGWLAAEIDRAVALIDAAAREDPRKRFSNEAFDAAVAYVREFARVRPDVVLREIASQ